MAIHIVPTGANTFSNWKQKNIACASIRSTPHAILVCIRPLRNDLAIFLIFNSAIQCKKENKKHLFPEIVFLGKEYSFSIFCSVIDLARYIHMHLYHIASWHQQNIHIISHKNMPIHSSLKFSVFLYTQHSHPFH